jgi:hypothetical protein
MTFEMILQARVEAGYDKIILSRRVTYKTNFGITVPEIISVIGS